MDRIVIPILIVVSAGLTAGVLDFIAYTDLGFAQDNIRTQALILAAIIGIGLAAGSVIQKWSK